jgi:hypothetical protein
MNCLSLDLPRPALEELHPKSTRGNEFLATL